MLIRCEKCQALFSLQDGVVRGKAGEIPPAFAVECGRCLSTFRAAAPAGMKTSPGRPRVATPAPPVASPSKAGKPKPSAAAERPVQSAPTTATLARTLKPHRPGVAGSEDDAYAKQISGIENRRKVTLWVLGAVALAIVLAIAIPLIRKRMASLPAAAKAKLEQAHRKLLLDDLPSLEQAASLDAEASKLAPGDARPEGERAFALLLAAGSHKDLADREEAKAAQLSDEVARLQIAKPDGYEKQVEVIRTKLLSLNDEREPHVNAANQLLLQGRNSARAALEQDPDEAEALRAMALYGALTNAVESGVSYADRAEGFAPGDPFTTYVRAQLWLSGNPSREKQDKGLYQLALVRQSAPELLRALYDTAAVDADRQLAGPAKDSLDKLLAQNPLHERAEKLRSSLEAR